MCGSCITKTSVGLIIRYVNWDTINLSRCGSSIYTKIIDGQNWIRTKIIKNDYYIEPHISRVKNKYYQRAPMRLRVSAYKLNIEIGRHRRPYIPRQQRLCLHCNFGEIDDEIHFLLKCNFHAEARHSLFIASLSLVICLYKNQLMRLISSRLSGRIRTLSFWMH